MIRFPIYLPSRGRPETCYTAHNLAKENIPFFLVIEPQDKEIYSKFFKPEQLLVMSENDQGVAYVRNWIKDYSISRGEEYHWQLDDNIRKFMKLEGKRIPASIEENFSYIENYMDRYSNVAISGMAYCTFAFGDVKEVSINKSPASGVLVKNNVEVRWRKGVIVDIDYTLQCLTKGYCSIVFNRLLIDKPGPLKMKGGCTEIEYEGNKRELRTLKFIEYWPNYCKLKEKYGRKGLSVCCLGKKFLQRPILKI
jgi:hypothetical protein